MITINLRGGIGNQMFQYACGLALAKKRNTQLIVDAAWLDMANAVGDIYRPFSLQYFDIQADVIRSGFFRAFAEKVRRKLFGMPWYVGFEPSVLDMPDGTHLDGYFQSEKYFASVVDQLRKEFTPKKLSERGAAFEKTIQQDSHAVSIHIRRGDYVTHPNFGGICDVAYYTDAITAMRKKDPQVVFYVFSDDIAWCKEHLPLGDTAVFVSDAPLKDYEELWLMSRCARGHIISNSTFSWWGAWLNPHADKTIICPKQWDKNPETNAVHMEKVAETWIRL